MPDRVPARSLQKLFMQAQGLHDDPRRRLTTASLARTINQLGYLQVDSINVVERAHHLSLGARFDDYSEQVLVRLTEEKRGLFEHWTHDASLIPVSSFGHWKHRFAAWKAKMATRPNWMERLGPDPDAAIARVRDRITKEGPLQSRDFESDHKSSGWWNWKPEKSALEFLWRSGELGVSGRENFAKAYDLMERIHPDECKEPIPDLEETRDWLCREALERLVIATPGEIARYFEGLSPKEAGAWCKEALAEERIVELEVADAGEGRPWKAVALPEWRRRLDRVGLAPRRMRLLTPFDPILRDRRRLQRVFGFEYRIETFIPAAKRQYGYYVMPILEGGRFVGRLDPKFHRDRGVLEVRGVWWEPGIAATAARKSRLEGALGRLARQVGAEDIALP
jgi:uncharacterized protein YcaQ